MYNFDALVPVLIWLIMFTVSCTLHPGTIPVEVMAAVITVSIMIMLVIRVVIAIVIIDGAGTVAGGGSRRAV